MLRVAMGLARGQPQYFGGSVGESNPTVSISWPRDSTPCAAIRVVNSFGMLLALPYGNRMTTWPKYC
jgi:hypothetical protein